MPWGQNGRGYEFPAETDAAGSAKSKSASSTNNPPRMRLSTAKRSACVTYALSSPRSLRMFRRTDVLQEYAKNAFERTRLARGRLPSFQKQQNDSAKISVLTDQSVTDGSSFSYRRSRSASFIHHLQTKTCGDCATGCRSSPLFVLLHVLHARRRRWVCFETFEFNVVRFPYFAYTVGVLFDSFKRCAY